MFHLHPHSYRWLGIQARMDTYLSDVPLYRCDIHKCCLTDIPFGDVLFYTLDRKYSLLLVLHLAFSWIVKHLIENKCILRCQS